MSSIVYVPSHWELTMIRRLSKAIRNDLEDVRARVETMQEGIMSLQTSHKGTCSKRAIDI